MAESHDPSEGRPAHQELASTFFEDADVYFEGGRWNNLCDIALSIAGLCGSLAATVLVSAVDMHRWIVATAAAVPAFCTGLQKILNVRGRSAWYFLKAARVEALALKLEHDSQADLHDYAVKKGEIELEMEKEWSQVISSGMKASKKSSTRVARKTARK